jgi:excisionase family DNA binding protein
MEDRLLNRVTEVAVFFNVSRSKAYELLASGDLPSVKIDRTRLVRGSDLSTTSSRFSPRLSRRIPSAATSSISSSHP